MARTILIVNWRLPIDPQAGGAERVTLKHAQSWTKAGYSVIWLSGSPTGTWQRFCKQGIEYIAVGPTKMFFILAGLLRYLMIRVKVDCIVDEIHGFPSWSVLWAPGTPKVAFIHEVAMDIWDTMVPFPINWIGKYVERSLTPYLYRNVPFWVDAPSVATELAKTGIPSHAIHAIPCAIDLPKKAPVMGKKESDCTLIILSRIVAMKGITQAIDTFVHLRTIVPSAKLWIVGDGDVNYIAQIRHRLARQGAAGEVKFWGRVSEEQKFSLLSRAHFLIHASQREGFGLTVLEAEHVGTPSATFRVTGLSDLVTDGYNGVQVPYADTKSLAIKIAHLISDAKAYTTLRRNAISHEKLYTWDRSTKRSMRLITTQMHSKE